MSENEIATLGTQVTSGTVKTGTMWYSTFYVKWNRASYSVENNQSKINWEAGLIITNNAEWYSNAVKINSIYINGSKVLSGKTYSNIKGTGTHKLASGSVTIDHNSDGTKEFDVSISGWLYDNGNTSGKDTFELVPIPRASKIIGQNVDIGKVMKIQIERPIDTFTHQIFYEFGNLSGVIATNVATEMNWITPATMYAEVKESNSGTGKLRCVTYNGDTYIGETETEFTAYVTNANPVINGFSYKDNNSATVFITEDDQRIIRDNSQLVFTIGTATPQKSATIKKYELTFNGYTQELTEAGTISFGRVNLSSNSKAVLKVTDSRGNTSSKEIEVIIDDWKIPTGIISLGRKNNFYSETILKVDATYSSLNGKNSLAIQYQYKKTTEKTFSALYNTEDNVETIIELDNNYKWNVIVIVGDRIGETTYYLYVDRGMPIIFFDRQNENVGINCFPSSENKLEIDGKLKTTNFEATGDAIARNLPIATGYNTLESFDNVETSQDLFKSGFYSANVDNTWYHLLNSRHRNGHTDGTSYGLQIRNKFALGSNLEIRQQNAGTWGEWRTIAEQKEKNIVDNSGTNSSYIILGNLLLCWGRVAITPKASTPTAYTLKFPKAFAHVPSIQATPITGSPGTVVLGVSIADMSTTGCNIYLTRTNATTTSVDWFAIGDIS